MTEGKAAPEAAPKQRAPEPQRQEEVEAAEGSAGEDKFYAYANPEKGDYSVTVYTDEGDKTFYRHPSAHPEGPEAQMVTQEEFDSYNFETAGVMALARDREEG
jgi:hypothetical protein